MKIQGLALTALLSLTACKYSNTFTGTFYDEKGSPSSTSILTAYSKNLNKYCVSVNLDGPIALQTGISPSEVIDENAILEKKAFNTKDSNCNSDEATYLVGTRSVRVLSQGKLSEMNQCGRTTCERIDYAVYNYVEDLNFEVRDAKTDALKGKYEGVGEAKQITDYDKIVRRTGCTVFCLPPHRGNGMNDPGNYGPRYNGHYRLGDVNRP